MIESGADTYKKFNKKDIIKFLEEKNKFLNIATKDRLEILKIFIRTGIFNPEHDRIPNIPGANTEVLSHVMFEKDNKFQNNELHRAIYYLNKDPGGGLLAQEMGKPFEEILQRNSDKLNIQNIDGKTPLSICDIQKVRKELVRWGADINRLPEHIKQNDKAELQELSTQYNTMIKDAVRYIDREFKSSNNKEDFINKIRESIERLYFKENHTHLSQINVNQIISETEKLYENLQEKQSMLDKMPFIEKFIDKIKAIFGQNSLKMFITELSEEFQENIKNTIKEETKTRSMAEKIKAREQKITPNYRKL
ncbi:hypothetical protein NOVO_00235 [Rickettsiales bacterium Ac37b]|nr:hypothetical protein NOVO_00235 [Rickettsiales bacterium Ac37b]